MRRQHDLARLPITIDLRAVSRRGVRAGLAVALPVIAGSLLHAPILLQSALGALLTCLCDAGGPIPRRVPALLSFALLSSAMIAGFGLARPIGYALIPVAVGGVFCCALARIYNQTALQVGNLLSVALVLSLDHRFGTIGQALHWAGAFAAGSLWAFVLTMTIWRLHPNRPVRRYVALAYLALAELAENLAALAEAEHPDWDQHARLHRRAVREAVEAARTAIAERLRWSGSASPATGQSLLRLENAEEMFRTTIGLSDLLEVSRDPDLSARGAVLARDLAAVLRAFAPHIVDDSDRGLASLGAAIAGLAGRARGLPETDRLRGVADALIERLRASMNLSGFTDAVRDAPAAKGAWKDAVWGPIVANFTWRSAPLRHAARVAAVAAAGFLVTFTWPTSYGHWLTITLILTLQPYYTSTLQRALERIGGTVAGALFAAVLGLFCRTPVEIAAAVFPLSVGALALRQVNFALYFAALTPVVVLLVELGAPNHGYLTIAAMRTLYALIGGALAVIGTMVLWPSWEPNRLEEQVQEAARLHGAFARRTLAFLAGETGQAEVDTARRDAGLSSNNLEASLSRALLEPAHARTAQHRLEAALVVDAALRRLAGRLTAIPTDAGLRGAVPGAWRAWIEASSAALETQPEPQPREDAPEALHRIARQLVLASAALRRFAAG